MARRREGPSEKGKDQDELVLERTFDAPRSEVWKEWTEPDRMSRWFGPRGFTSPINEIDLRVGGRYLNCMRSPEGDDYCSSGEYREIVPEEKLVMTDSFSDREGRMMSPSEYGMSRDFPEELLVTTTFEETGNGRTRMTVKHSGIKNISDRERKGMEQGWNESFDKLENDLKQKRGR